MCWAHAGDEGQAAGACADSEGLARPAESCWSEGFEAMACGARLVTVAWSGGLCAPVAVAVTKAGLQWRVTLRPGVRLTNGTGAPLTLCLALLAGAAAAALSLSSGDACAAERSAASHGGTMPTAAETVLELAPARVRPHEIPPLQCSVFIQIRWRPTTRSCGIPTTLRCRCSLPVRLWGAVKPCDSGQGQDEAASSRSIMAFAYQAPGAAAAAHSTLRVWLGGGDGWSLPVQLRADVVPQVRASRPSKHRLGLASLT